MVVERGKRGFLSGDEGKENSKWGYFTRTGGVTQQTVQSISKILTIVKDMSMKSVKTSDRDCPWVRATAGQALEEATKQKKIDTVMEDLS